MRKLLLVITLAFMPLLSFGQLLTLDQLIKLYKTDVDDANDYLMGQGWEYLGLQKEDSSDYEFVSWAYGYDEDNEVANRWFNIFYDQNKDRVCVKYQAPKVIINGIKSKAISIGMKKVDSRVDDDGSIIALYSGTNYLIRFITTVDNEGFSVVYIFPKERFEEQ
jgi:hypothetical protein